MGIIDTAKAHPVITGGAVLAAIVLFVVIANSGGSDTVVTGTAMTSTDQGTNMQMANLQAQSDANSITANLQALNIQAATKLASDKIAADTTNNANYLAAKVTSEKTQADLTATTLNSSLAAQVATFQTQKAYDTVVAGYSNQQAIETIRSNENIATQNILAQTVITTSNNQVAQANIFARTTLDAANISADTTRYLATLNAQTSQLQTRSNENVATQSWWDKIF